MAGLLALGLTYVGRNHSAAEAAPRSHAAPAGVARDATTHVADHESAKRSPMKQIGKIDTRRAAQGCAGGTGEDCPFLEPDDETLQELARCGIVRYEVPRFLDDLTSPTELDPAWVELTGLTDAEAQGVVAASRAFRERLGEQATALAVEVGLERQWAETSAFWIVIGMIQHQAEADEHAASLQRIARERAGLEEPPGPDAELTPTDRANRLLASAGDAFEAAMAERLGAARAKELRAAGDGWPGRRTQLGNQCEELQEERAPVDERWTPTSQTDARRCIDDWKGSGCRFLAPPDVLRQEMARCGVVRFDFPTFLMARDVDPAFSREFAEAVELTPAEEAQIAEVVEGFRAKLYEDVDGDGDGGRQGPGLGRADPADGPDARVAGGARRRVRRA